MATHSVNVVIRARDLASKKFGRIGRASRGMDGMLRKAAGAISLYFGARQVVGFLKYGAAFEKTMSRVMALSGAVGEEQKRLTDTAKKLGERTAFTAAEVGQGMSYLALAGFEVNEIIASMPKTLNLAAAGELDLAQACSITAGIMRGMGLGTDELGTAVDVLSKAFTSSNTDLVQLGEGMKYVGPIGRTAGKDLVELTSVIQVLSNANIQGSMAGTSLRMILAQLSGGSSVAVKGMAALGIVTTDTSGKLLPMAQIIDIFNEKMAGMGAAEKTAKLMTIFGKRAGPGMAALLSEGGDALRAFQESLGDSTGHAANIAKIQLDNVAGSFTKLKSAAAGIVVDLFGKQQGWLKSFIDRIKNGVSFIGVIVQNFGLSMDIVWSSLALGMYIWWEDTKHLFVTVIPELLSWFGRNWKEIFTDMWNATKAIFINMGKNILEFFKATWSWLKGEGFDFKWTGLLDGFEATLTEMPKIAKRAVTDTEEQMAKEIADMQLKFAENLAAKFEDEKIDVAAAVKKAVTEVLPVEPEAEVEKTKKAGRSGLSALQARFLTFAPGTQFDYQHQTATGVGQMVRLQGKANSVLEKIEKAVAKTGAEGDSVLVQTDFT